MSQSTRLPDSLHSLRLPLIVCFDPVELEFLHKGFQVSRTADVPGGRSPLFIGAFEGKPACLLRLPFGDRPAALTAALQNTLAWIRPECLIAVGTVMACDTELCVGDLVAPRTVYHTEGPVAATESLLELISHGTLHTRPVHLVDSLTTGTFVQTPAAAVRLRESFPGIAVIEMEDAWLGRFAGRAGIPWVALRAVSDYGDFAEHKKNLPAILPGVVACLRRFLRALRLRTGMEISPNPSFRLPYGISLRRLGAPLSIPDAVRFCRKWLGRPAASDFIRPGALLELVVFDDWFEERPVSTPSGLALVREEHGHWKAWADPGGEYLFVTCSAEFDRGTESPPPLLKRAFWEDVIARECPILVTDARSGRVPENRKIHIQGLNSISAEAEEGLLAACTVEEFTANGFQVTDSAQADIWVYRTAHAATESYFQPEYNTPTRVAGSSPAGKFLIVTGLGPAIDAAAAGGDAAELLLAGDEQAERLVQLLEDLSAGPFSVADVLRFPGIALKMAPGHVVFSRFDQRLLLNEEGLNALAFEPASMRMMYSTDYDAFLHEYFAISRRNAPATHLNTIYSATPVTPASPATPAFPVSVLASCSTPLPASPPVSLPAPSPNPAPLGSFLLLTSRGCGNECSICCSGGYQPFAALRPDVLVGILAKIRQLFRMETHEFIDIFFLDSNFNKIARRVIEFADLLENTGLRPFFRFHIRHNGLRGFLLSPADCPQTPLVNEESIQAYRRLGIEEIVIGIDSYTETSVRMLKTSMTRLKIEGEKAMPCYTFPEIEAVIAAISAQGMKTRGFLLMNNPFTGDTDRIATYYNLFRLAVQFPDFVIDFDSSSHVNDLKPFPGAPFTRIAEQVPGLIQPRSLSFSIPHDDVEAMLRFDSFVVRRHTPALWGNFLASTQQTRFGLADYFMARLRSLKRTSHQANPAFVGPLRHLLTMEQTIAPLIARVLPPIEFFQKNETQIRELCDALERELPKHSQIETTPDSRAEKRFYQLLKQL